MLKLYEDWQSNILEPFLNNNKEHQYSNVFIPGIPLSFTQPKGKIMIIGQMTNNFGEYGTNTLEELEQFGCNYLERQIYGKVNDWKYNSSPFWQFFRKLKEGGYDLIWNNVDKVHKIINGETIWLSEEEELALNAPYGSENKSLLEREIEMISPSAIIFITGPNYAYSMATSFGLPKPNLFSIRPTKAKSLVNIQDHLGLSIPVFWTYHPNYLSRTYNPNISDEHKCNLFEENIKNILTDLNNES